MIVLSIFFSLMIRLPLLFSFFFFNDTATTEIYTLSLHDALPIYLIHPGRAQRLAQNCDRGTALSCVAALEHVVRDLRSEEHTSELQSRLHLVCRLLLEKKKKNTKHRKTSTTNTQSTTSAHVCQRH